MIHLYRQHFGYHTPAHGCDSKRSPSITSYAQTNSFPTDCKKLCAHFCPDQSGKPRSWPPAANIRSANRISVPARPTIAASCTSTTMTCAPSPDRSRTRHLQKLRDAAGHPRLLHRSPRPQGRSLKPRTWSEPSQESQAPRTRRTTTSSPRHPTGRQTTTISAARNPTASGGTPRPVRPGGWGAGRCERLLPAPPGLRALQPLRPERPGRKDQAHQERRQRKAHRRLRPHLQRRQVRLHALGYDRRACPRRARTRA